MREDARGQRLGLDDPPELGEGDGGDERRGRRGRQPGGGGLVEALGQGDDGLRRARPDQRVGEEARQPLQGRVLADGEAVDGGTEQRDRAGRLGAAALTVLPSSSASSGRARSVSGSRREPAQHALGGGAGQRRAGGGDRPGGLRRLAGGEPVLDRVGRAPGLLQRGGQAGVQGRAAVAALLAAAQQQRAEERVVAHRAGRRAGRTQEQPAVADLGHEAVGELEGAERERVELGGQRGLLQALGELRGQHVEDLFGQEGEGAPVGGRRAAVERGAAGDGGGGHAQRPALGRLEDGVDLIGVGLAAAARVQQLGALARVEDQIGRRHHRQPSRGLQARGAHGQLGARRHRDAYGAVGRQQLGHQRAGGRRGAHVLGVVEHQHERLDEQLGEAAGDLGRQRAGVDPLSGHDQALAEHVDRARHRVLEGGQDPGHEGPRVVALGAPDPGPGEAAALDRGLERGGLAEARAGHHEQRCPAEGVGQPLLERIPCDPGGRAWHGRSI